MITLMIPGSFVIEKFERDLLLERLDERLLAGDAVEVRVRVAKAGVVERCAAVSFWYPGWRLIVGVLIAARVVVEVALVDVDVDPADLVHDLLEAAEVDGDDVVDRRAR